jgi:excisionase family DNA binding protein
MSLPKREWLTVEDVADYLGVSKTTVFRLLKKNELKHHRVGRLYKITSKQVEDYLELDNERAICSECGRDYDVEMEHYSCPACDKQTCTECAGRCGCEIE